MRFVLRNRRKRFKQDFIEIRTNMLAGSLRCSSGKERAKGRGSVLEVREQAAQVDIAFL
jgi:hypothetical protein